tara:strand:+ start:483 stop:692 length:210 start_codon:yes stop_codon:yes gene_type:complete
MNDANFLKLKLLIEELSSVVDNQQKQLNLQNDLLNIQKFKFEKLEKTVNSLEKISNINLYTNSDDKRFI